MAAVLSPEVLEDDVAVLLARVIAAANTRARDAGVDVPDSQMTITEATTDGRVVWRVSYCPRNYVGRRGGDLVVDVDPHDAKVLRVLRGQ